MMDERVNKCFLLILRSIMDFKSTDTISLAPIHYACEASLRRMNQASYQLHMVVYDTIKGVARPFRHLAKAVWP